jgi:hypothetical protein
VREHSLPQAASNTGHEPRAKPTPRVCEEFLAGARASSARGKSFRHAQQLLSFGEERKEPRGRKGKFLSQLQFGLASAA